MTTTTLHGPPVDTPAPSPQTRERSFVRRLWRGRPEDARWVRPAFLGALLVIGALYTWNLTASGYANSFYSAAVQAGSQSWKAFFFGSLDAGNAITVDKPPAALWPMALSVRLLGLNSFAVLFPQVLMAVATAGVLYASVRRRFPAPAGLLTMAVFALTPVAALMFRFNNPDAALALLMATAVYCTQRALEKARTKWLLLAGTAVGLAFLVKTLQAFLILPVLALVYVALAPAPLRKRIGQVLLAGAAMVVAGGWWVAVVELWPASSRPYIGGSQNNSFLELTFGYNGLGRINGEETGSVGGRGGNGGGGWGETGWDRMFGSNIGGQISWLIPAALILLVGALFATRRLKRTDATRAAFLLWGGSLLITMVIFSFMQGIFHEYYTVALAPYIAPLAGMGAALLWAERGRAWASLTLAAAMTATAAWGYVLLDRSSDYLPWLKWLVLVGGLLAALGLVFANRLGRRVALGVVALSVVTGVAGPAAYSLTTLGEGHSGSIVTAGPSVAGGMGGMGGGRPGGGGGFPGGGQNQQGGQQGRQGQQGGGMGQPPAGGFGGGFPGGGQNQQGRQGGPQNQTPGGQAPGGQAPGGQTGEGGGMGGLLNGASVSDEAKELLEANAGDYTWAAAAIGSQNAASYQLATGEPVMAIGGFNGTDPSPTLAQFKQYVADGRIHYFIASGMGGGPGGGADGSSSQIGSWVEENFEEVTAGSATFYDLTQPKSGS
ncbi:glycosyltransferase family 39 protein [Streptomyces sp. NPDC052610]|uniref:ArnT family glycosyltransferase n=1 Tax=Streptomyces sp. NPDC052610 TaxID=3154952 RepID=UPI00343C9C5F